MTGDRGQIVTVEAILAALLLVGSLVFAMHVVAVTANTASTTSAEVSGDHRSLATGTLDHAVADGSLKATMLAWNETGEAFVGAEEDYFTSRTPSTAFGALLNNTFADRQVRYNVHLHFENETGEHTTQRLIHYGTATDDAVRVERTVTLYDDDRLRNETGHARNVTVADTGGFYAANTSPETRVYSVIRVEVVLWQS